MCRNYSMRIEEPTGNGQQPPTQPSQGTQMSQTARPAQPGRGTQMSQTAGSAQSSPGGTFGRQVPAAVLSVSSVPYRKWSPIALAIFRELSWAVVSGVHIQETQNQSAVTQLSCPTNDVGNIVFNKTGTLSCDIAGEGLDKVATLRLRNAKDATDTDTADGPVTVSGDATKAKVAFPLAKLGSLNQPAYKVYMVTSTGVESFANQTLHFDLNPYVSDLSPSTADPTKQSSMPFTLKGFHLDKIAKVQLFEGAYKTGQTSLLEYGLDSAATPTQASFTVKASDDDLKKKASQGSGETIAVELVVKNSSGSPVDGGSIAFKSSSSVLFTSETVTFGTQSEKTTSSAKTVTLTNSGTTALTDFKATISGANATSFSETDTCGSSVAAGAKCEFTVKFTPKAAGKLTATLSISYTAQQSQQSKSVSLSGTGKASKQ